MDALLARYLDGEATAGPADASLHLQPRAGVRAVLPRGSVPAVDAPAANGRAGPAGVCTDDLGQPGRVNYAQAFQTALAVLAKSGFSQAEIDMMTKQNPARFIGLK